jgi:hypothetical protein
MAADARFLSSYTWINSDDNFGGLSSIHLNDDGKNFLMTTDNGLFYSGVIERTTSEITGVNTQRLTQMKDTIGNSITGKEHGDSEGIAVRPDGRIYVSFERYHRVWTYRDVRSEAAWLPRHPDFKHLQNNSSLEALAIDKKGQLYTLPERSGALNKPFPVYRYNGKVWDNRLSIPRRGNFLVVGADFGPDEKFYLLERDFRKPIGVYTRVRRFDVTETSFTNEELLIQSSLNEHDNLEGISVWWDDLDKIRITLISDDNFNFFQRTELVEYIID